MGKAGRVETNAEEGIAIIHRAQDGADIAKNPLEDL
jgi:hypothetical protein